MSSFASRRVPSFRGSGILIHEATFDDSKQDHAVRKRHSTVSEALSSADAMGAQHVVLTHFSQRYPSAVPSPAPREGSSAAKPVIFAMDGMTVELASEALHNLAAVGPAIQAAVLAAFT